MKYYIDEIEENRLINYYPDRNHCYLDIETTGFSRQKDLIYLIGLLYFNKENNKWILKQYFLENPDNEKLLIKSVIDKLEKFDLIITYNGENFDLPFIRSKAMEYDLNTFNMDILESFDLYRFVNRNQDFLNIPNLKLKTIEEYLGFKRKDMYTGYECIKFYKEYTKNCDKKYKDIVLQHNYEDLIYLLKSFKIKDIIFERKKVKIDKYELLIDDILFKNNFLQINGLIKPSLKIDIKSFQPSFNFITQNLKNFSFEVPINQGYIDEGIIANYIDSNKYNIPNKKEHNYNIPENIYILSIEKKLEISNIKNLLFYTTKELFNF